MPRIRDKLLLLFIAFGKGANDPAGEIDDNAEYQQQTQGGKDNAGHQKTLKRCDFPSAVQKQNAHPVAAGLFIEPVQPRKAVAYGFGKNFDSQVRGFGGFYHGSALQIQFQNIAVKGQKNRKEAVLLLRGFPLQRNGLPGSYEPIFYQKN